MNAHKVAATFMEDGTLVLKGLPFHAGDTVEIIILEQPQEDQRPWLAQGSHSLAGTVQHNDDALASLVDEEYLDAVAETLTEWNSEADDLAYSHL
jgi:hypothetical protein